jgi:4-carboxymuconolactone decarboxylase
VTSADVDAGVPLLAVDDPTLVELADAGVEPAKLYRALAHRPTLLAAWLAFARALRTQCELPRTLRELVILRSAQLTGGRYVWSDHVPMALEAGVLLEQIESLARWQQTNAFSPAERATLAFADELATAAEVSDAALGALARHFDAPERVELALTAGFYAMVPRVLAALRVPLPDRAPASVAFPEPGERQGD